MTFETFLMLLFVCSVLTGLTTEAVKTLLKEQGKRYHTNLLAGGISTIISAAVSISYGILIETAWNGKLAVYFMALVFLSWLASMVGYDKVVQAMTQWKGEIKNDEKNV